MVWQLKCGPDGTGRIGDHLPRQVGDLTGPETGFCRQQHHDFVAHWLSGRLGKEEEVVDVGVGQDLCLLARHHSNQSNDHHQYTIKVHLIQTTNNLLAFASLLSK